ncbi:efflux RND transporter periplasmic adaptor subunit [Sphingomonas endolithica]|uniref:efflux RND transporter periplasmic adaptor subunit n=1 Tax=Sphingomonas endolithica TaxID=2972485 RepID=UPI0021AEF31A|nr:efflux RND transporter periplasmic adaptor subunit [Sphingomonas sp. ZFBP2030]
MSDQQPRSLRTIGIGAGVVALAVVAVGIGARVSADHKLETVAREDALPTVLVITPATSGAGQGLTLPGNIQAYNSAAVYARANGYVRRWLVDIGDHVAAGQTLAIIDAPEVDQQLAQAQADFQTAAANQALARTTAVRWDALLARDAVSKQEADEKRGALAANTALTNAQSANVRRLRALKGFTRITAPFAGVVTSRSAQIGALIVAGNAASQPLFTVSDMRRLRIFVRVPQGSSGQIHSGMQAKLTVPEFPGREFTATLTRSAGAVDPASGSVLVQLDADNQDGALKPGGYAQVRFPLAAATGITLPASAVMVRESGTVVAIVDAQNRVHIRPVTISRDEGAVVQIGAGLTGRERVVDTPPDAIAEGDRVRVQKAAPQPKAAS